MGDRSKEDGSYHYKEIYKRLGLEPLSFMYSASFAPTGPPAYDADDAADQSEKLSMFLLANAINQAGVADELEAKCEQLPSESGSGRDVTDTSTLIGDIAKVYWYRKRLHEIRRLSSRYRDQEVASSQTSPGSPQPTKSGKQIERKTGDNLTILSRSQTLILLDLMRG